MGTGCLQHHLGATLNRVAENAGADGRKCDAGQSMFVGKSQCAQRGRAQLGILIAGAHNRADGMNDIFCRQTAAGSNGRRARPHQAMQAYPFIAFLLNPVTALADDGPGNPSTMRQVLIGGVDDGIRLHSGNIAYHQLYGRIVELNSHAFSF